MAAKRYDAIVIGTGAGGGTLAYRLAAAGKRTLLLERGDFIRRQKENWDPGAVILEGRYQAKETWKTADGEDLHPHTTYAVGGNTKMYGAALFRMRREDFGEVRHHGGVSPAWPISYDELEPYYAKAERLYHVHGARGEDPTEPGSPDDYPHPAVSHEPPLARLAEDFAAQGLRPFHTPLGIQLDERDPRASRCIRCNTCDGFPCLVQAKSDAQVCAVEPALGSRQVTLLNREERVLRERPSLRRPVVRPVITPPRRRGRAAPGRTGPSAARVPRARRPRGSRAPSPPRGTLPPRRGAPRGRDRVSRPETGSGSRPTRRE